RLRAARTCAPRPVFDLPRMPRRHRTGAPGDQPGHRQWRGRGRLHRGKSDGGSGRPVRRLPGGGMSRELLRLDDGSVGFAGQAVLQNIQLSVRANEILTLIGPNGAGKTTLVRAVLGLLKPDRGEVWRK